MNAVKEEALFAMEDDLHDGAAAEEAYADSRKYLIFTTDDLKLGVDAGYVVEILNNQTITYLPMMPEYIRGVFNMRGQIIPVMDIRMRLGKMPVDDNDLLIVLNYQNSQLGILVDAVEQMIDIPDEILMPMPAQSNQRLVSAMCTIPDGSGTMLVLDCEQVLAHE